MANTSPGPFEPVYVGTCPNCGHRERFLERQAIVLVIADQKNIKIECPICAQFIVGEQEPYSS